MDHADLLEQARRQANEARAIEHLIDTTDFRLVFVKAEEDARLAAEQLLTRRDLHGLRRWMDTERHKYASYRDMTVAQLRKLAASRKVFQYQYLTKEDIVLSLEKQDERDWAARRNSGTRT